MKRYGNRQDYHGDLGPPPPPEWAVRKAAELNRHRKRPISPREVVLIQSHLEAMKRHIADAERIRKQTSLE